MRAAVTGGSGVVGGAVVRHLVAAGHTVRAASRSPDSDESLSAAGAEPIRADVLEGASLLELCDGAEILFHVAGVNEMCVHDPTSMITVNVDGSVNAIRAAERAGVRRVVHTSSAAVLGEMPGTVGSEASAHRGWFLSEYERSKYLAEEAVSSLDADVEIVIVNPSSVQGPGRASGTGRLILDVLRGRLPVLVDTELSIVDIDDCAAGHLRAAEAGQDRRRYVLNSATIAMRDAVGMLEVAAGRELSVRYLSPSAAAAAAPAVDLLRRVFRLELPVCGEMLRTVAHGTRYDGSRAARELGVEYTHPGVTIERLVGWLRAEGLLS